MTTTQRRKKISDSPTASQGVGRPRNEITRKLILRTTLDLLKTDTLQSISIEAIAREAGVSKATIYRWWDSKGLIVIDAFIENHLVRTPIRRDVPPGQAIAEHFVLLVEQFSGWSGHLVAQILADAQANPIIGEQFRERFHYGRRAAVSEMLTAWKKSGDLKTDTENEILMDLIYSPIYMRLMVGQAPLTRQFAISYLSFVYSLLGAQQPVFDVTPASLT